MSLRLVATGAATSTYSPGITSTASSQTVNVTAAFVGAVCADNALLSLLTDSMSGSFTTSCAGPTSSVSLTGTLTWSDLSTSTYTISSFTRETVSGHSVAHYSGTVDAGCAHYAGKQIDLLKIRLAAQLTACFSGGSVTSSTGTDIVQISG
ncbi:hypothetical protein TR51_00045 [Kitasatospora griseola]|uniref:Uncharacterized protein n=1 Tax=Kitasatospora griseola TaxID=2064 RepID=A0A0D0Q0V9_KITGR|nr:hypothetical protein [Kitasatospora griseola]KIQ66142.1 hypothetical protein TR51_00045 [Kitasatospora griseola]